MRRRELIAFLGGAPLWAVSASAQKRERTRRIGFLLVGSPQSSNAEFVVAFRKGLADLGYVEDRDFVLDLRWADGHLDRLVDLATELVRDQVDVIVTSSLPATIAAHKASTSLPIVQGSGGDLVLGGLVASLARPGGNVTGLTNQVQDLGPKMLELLLAVVPGAKRIGVLDNPNNPVVREQLASIERSASALKLPVVTLSAGDPTAMHDVLLKLPEQRLDGLLVLGDTMSLARSREVVELVGNARVPAIYGFHAFTADGGLISYGTDIRDNYRRSAFFVDRILKGANPANLPVEQPTKFQLVINLKTARALGLTIPDAILARADEVIE